MRMHACTYDVNSKRNIYKSDVNTCTVNFAYNDTRRGIKKSVLIREVSLYPKSHYSWMGLCSGHGNSVVIRELSLYPQSLLLLSGIHRSFFAMRHAMRRDLRRTRAMRTREIPFTEEVSDATNFCKVLLI